MSKDKDKVVEPEPKRRSVLDEFDDEAEADKAPGKEDDTVTVEEEAENAEAGAEAAMAEKKVEESTPEAAPEPEVAPEGEPESVAEADAEAEVTPPLGDLGVEQPEPVEEDTTPAYVKNIGEAVYNSILLQGFHAGYVALTTETTAERLVREFPDWFQRVTPGKETKKLLEGMGLHSSVFPKD